MNHAYRLIWSVVHNCLVAVSEAMPSRGKKAGGAKRLLATAIMLSGANALAQQAPVAPNALPQGGQVAHGQVAISQTANQMTMNQSTNQAIVNWQQFNIGSQATVNINQPSSQAVMLNRVVGADPSQILGQLNANGQVIIVNPNGILIGRNATVNVGGIIASTMSITDSDFIAGRYRFNRNGSTASISNEGTVNVAPGGIAALLATNIYNPGIIVAQRGQVALASGDATTLSLTGGPVLVQVDPSQVAGLIQNSNLIEAEGGAVFMTAKAANSLLSSSINNTGAISATGVTGAGGEIRLVADYVANSGTVNANGQTGGQINISATQHDAFGSITAQGRQGVGGQVSIDANRTVMIQAATINVDGVVHGGQISMTNGITGNGGAYLSGTLSANASQGVGGNIDITGRDLNLFGGTISASGATGGGQINVGGGFQGNDPNLPNSQNLTVNATQVDVSATQNGHGGGAVFWSDVTTRFSGNVDARGASDGVKSTDAGGMVEISGAQNLGFSGTVLANRLLLDPANLSIVDPGNGVSFFDYIDPDSTATGFGSTVYELTSGKLMVFSPQYSGVAGSGAVYVYDRSTHAVTTLLRDTGGVSNFTAMGNDTYVIGNSAANSGIGAVGFFDGNGSVSGRMDATNALIGNSYYGQGWGGTIMSLGGGNYAALMANSPANYAMRGAMKFFNSSNAVTELIGTLGPTNALVGTVQGSYTPRGPGQVSGSVNGSYGDTLGYRFIDNPTNQADSFVSTVQNVGGNNWIFSSPTAVKNQSNQVLGAMTVVTPATIASGSLKGSDLSQVSFIGTGGSGLGQGLGWNTYLEVGAGTGQWIYNAGNALIPLDSSSLASFTPGAVSSSNALMLNSADSVSSITQINGLNFVLAGGTSSLSNGSYARQLNYSGNFSNTFHGTLTAADATNAIRHGVLFEGVANQSIVDLHNGNYLLVSGSSQPKYYTFVDGSTGTSGITGLNSSNSLTTSLGLAGNTFTTTVLSNGGYVIQVGGNNTQGFPSPLPNGALFYGNGTSRQVGDLHTAGVSLLGDSTYRNINLASIKDLGNGSWAAVGGDYITWGGSSVSRLGTLDATKALSGTVGFVNLGNSAFATAVPTALGGAGAIARIDATNASIPTLSSANALVGSSTTDALGSNGVIDVGNGVGAFFSPNWNGGAGAVTTINSANAASRLIGTLSSSNSLVGSSSTDQVGADAATMTATTRPMQQIGTTGIYALATPTWNNNKGAVTLFDPGVSAGLTGVLGVSNSLVGNTAGDLVGKAYAPGTTGVNANGVLFHDLSGGRFALYSAGWQDASANAVGALTWLTPASGAVGTISNSNSLTGGAGNPIFSSLGSGYYSLLSPGWNSGAGAVTVFQPASAPVGAISSSNSLVNGNASNGNGELTDTTIVSLGGTLRAVLTPGWNASAGAITGFDLTSGIAGTIGSSISLTGAAGSELGDSLAVMQSGNLVVASPGWSGGKGAVTWIETTSTGALAALHGTLNIGSSNSLYGSTSGDRVGSGGVTGLSNNVFVVSSPDFRMAPSDTPGAVTLGNGLTNAIRGAVSPVNSYLASAGITTPLPFVIPMGSTGATISTGNQLSDVDIIYPVAMPQGSSTLAYSDYLGQSVTMLPSTITALLNLGTSVTLQATNRLYVGAPIIANNPNGNGGDLTLQTQSGDVMLGADARITTDNGNLLILAGRNFLNYASASPFNTGTGRWRVYANDPATSRVGNLNFDFKEYGKTYGQTLDGETALGGMTNAVVFAQQPSLSVPSGLWDNKDYDGTDALSSNGQSQAAITGLVDGDLLDATVKFATYHADPTYSGTNNIEMTIGSGGVTSSVATGRKPVFGYLNQPTAGTTTVVGQGQINPFNLQLDLSGTVTKVYDGTDAAPGGYTPQFVVPSWATAAPDAGLTFDTSQVSGSFNSDPYGWGGPFQQTGLVTGHSSGNGAQFFMSSGQISLNVPQGAHYLATDYSVQMNNYYVPGTITPRPIVAGLTASNKVYDGTTAATVTGSLSQIAPISSSYNGTSGASPDDVQLSGSATTGAATFSDANAGTGKTVTVNLSGLSLTGADAENYTIGSTTTTANITPKALTITGSTVANKQYDGTATATINVGTLSGFIGSETLSATGLGTFASVNVANGINVATTYTLANGSNGGLASNYSLASETLTGNITPAWLAVIVGSLTGSTTKVYDGSLLATLSAGNFLLTGWVNGDGTDVTVTKTSGVFADKNVGTNKLVTVSLTSGDFAASGSTLLSNYGLPTTASGNIGEITAKSLTASYSASNKVYNGNTTATVTGSSSDIVNGDTVNFAQTANFTDKNVANGKTINITGIGISGADAGNYMLQNTTATTTANITAKTLTASYTGNNKVYDQTTSATVTGSSSDIVNGDTVTFAQTAAFTDKNVANGKTINVSSISLAGSDAGNYSLQNTSATTTANITAKTLTVAYTGNNRVYDGSTAATVNDTISGIVSGDTVSVSESAAFGDKNVGTAKTVNISGMALAGADAGNYALSSTTATTTANITAKALTASFTGTNRVYDATTGATVSGGSSDIVGSDVVTVSQTSAAFTNKNVGTGKTINVSGISLGGTDAGNYSLQNVTATTSANITQASLAVSGATAANKVYDGTTSAIVTGGGVTALLSDIVTLSAANATFADKNVANAKAITTAYTISGTDAANYALVQQAGLTADITPKTVSAAYTGVNKVYDAGTTASVTGSLTGGIVGDTITYSQTAAFTDKNVGTGKTVSITGISLGGADAGNYILSNTTATTTANITPHALSIGGITANNKVYDGSVVANLIGSASLSGVLGSDVVSVSGSASGAFADKNVGTGKAILVSGLSLSGTDAANYTVGALSATADITAKALTAAYVGSNKVYDATTGASVTGSSSDIISGDTVSFSQSAAFANKNVGTGKSISVTGISLTGTDAGNYALQNSTAITTADITAKALTAAYVGSNKVYDATTGASVTGSSSDIISGDTVSFSQSAAFANKNVGTGKSISVTGISLTGTDAGNYALQNTTASTTANIAQASLSVTGSTAANKVYDGTTSASVTGGVVTALSGDIVSLSAANASFADKNVGSAKAITTAYSLSGTDAANYNLVQASGLTADITPAILSVSGTVASNRTYDATRNASMTVGTLSGLLGNETVSATALGVFDSANVGNRIATATYTLANGANGGLASNYQLANTTGHAAVITPFALILSGLSASNKTVDGLTAANVSNYGSLVGVIQGDQVTLSTLAAAANFADALVGVNKVVTVQGLQLAGLSANNYSFTGPWTTVADITALPTVSNNLNSRAGNSNVQSVIGSLISPSNQNSNTLTNIQPSNGSRSSNSQLPSQNVSVVSAGSNLGSSASVALGQSQLTRASTINLGQNVAVINSTPVVANSLGGSTTSATSSTAVGGAPQQVLTTLSANPRAGNNASSTLSASTSTNPVASGPQAISNSGLLSSEASQGNTITNVSPQNGFVTVKTISPVNVSAGSNTQVQLATDTFVHSDGAEKIKFDARLADGSPLPSWVTFDANTGSLDVKAPPNVVGEMPIRITASDSRGNVATTQVVLNLADS